MALQIKLATYPFKIINFLAVFELLRFLQTPKSRVKILPFIWNPPPTLSQQLHFSIWRKPSREEFLLLQLFKTALVEEVI